MTKKTYKILVFPGGTEVGIEIFKSLRYCKEVKLFSATSTVVNHAKYLYIDNKILPQVSDPNCLEELIKLLEEWDIDYIYPANSLVIDFLNIHRNELRCKILMADREVLEVTRFKSKTYNLLRGVIPTPAIYSTIDKYSNYPLFIKPDSLYGSQGIRVISSYESYISNPVIHGELICEYLPGEEYSVDCFSNSQGELIFVNARSRERIRMGTSMHCEHPSSEIQKILFGYAQIIQAHIPMSGAWFFQVKSDSQGILKLLEIEARIAGTMAFSRVQGINFPLMTLMDAIGLKLKILQNHCVKSIDRSLINRYEIDLNYDNVYVDLDDTLIIKGKINIQLVCFLYQCVNQGKKIILLSKSLAGNPDSLLRQHRIFELFDAIFWLREDEFKADYISLPSSIFIDDSFTQRLDVSNKLRISTFDSSMIECLLDERGG